MARSFKTLLYQQIIQVAYAACARNGVKRAFNLVLQRATRLNSSSAEAEQQQELSGCKGPAQKTRGWVLSRRKASVDIYAISQWLLAVIPRLGVSAFQSQLGHGQITVIYFQIFGPLKAWCGAVRTGACHQIRSTLTLACLPILFVSYKSVLSQRGARAGV